MKLPPRVNEPGRHNKKVIPLNYKPAMTFDEIALALHSTRQTVFTVYAKAMDKMRRELRRQLIRSTWRSRGES